MTEQIAAEAALDGFYILRTSLASDRPASRGCRARLQEPRTGRARVRVLQRPRPTDPPDPPPPGDPRPRARVHLHARLLPHLAPKSRVDAIAVHRREPARQPRPRRQGRPLTRRPAQGPDQAHHHRGACHSYRSLLAELATQTRNTIRLTGSTATFQKLTQPTPLQAHALDLAEHAPVTVDTTQTRTPQKPSNHRRIRRNPPSRQGELRIRGDEGPRARPASVPASCVSKCDALVEAPLVRRR